MKALCEKSNEKSKGKPIYNIFLLLMYSKNAKISLIMPCDNLLKVKELFQCF